MKSSKNDPVETALTAALDVLAALLLPLDVTPLRVAQIARASFVKAGATDARKPSSGTPHLARIAALTGLSRSEVKRIVSANFSSGKAEPEHLPRALRVLSAWRQSTNAKSKARRRTLKIVGPGASFESLCKQHSGDIPFRVILAELLRRKSVQTVRRGTAVTIAKVKVGRLGTQHEVETLLYAAAFLSELVDAERILLRRNERVAIPQEMSAAYVEKTTAGKVSAFLDHLPQTFSNARRAGRKRQSVNVYALVSRSKQTR